MFPAAMEKEKVRSKEEEEELDRKIALIREKNLKIEQRSKEVEADRVNNTDAVIKKATTPTTGNQPAKNKNKVWDREWDHGKTPADQWRENVPSIEHTGKLANAAGHNRRRNTNSGGHTGPAHQPEKITKGSRLEGRISVEKEKPAAGNKGPPRRTSQPNNGQQSNRKRNENGQPKNTAPIRAEQRNQKNNNNSERKSLNTVNQNGDANKNQGQSQKKSRPRRENDNYVVRKLLKQLVDKVDHTERRRKREEKQQEGNNGQTNGEPSSSKEPSTAPEPHQEKEDSPGKENIEAKPDANQNIIQLTRERVLTVEST